MNKTVLKETSKPHRPQENENIINLKWLHMIILRIPEQKSYIKIIPLDFLIKMTTKIET